MLMLKFERLLLLHNRARFRSYAMDMYIAIELVKLTYRDKNRELRNIKI